MNFRPSLVSISNGTFCDWIKNLILCHFDLVLQHGYFLSFLILFRDFEKKMCFFGCKHKYEDDVTKTEIQKHDFERDNIKDHI